MNLLQNAWKDALGVAQEPLLKIGSTDLTLLRLLGLVFIVAILWKVTHTTKRAIFKLSPSTTDPAIYLLSRIATIFMWILGILIGLNYLGFELSSFAFLGGAMGLGLGFGLQNILSNFVSGIIILFERTLKVGDTVELQSGVTGKVTEINLRYTRVTTSDSIDILVPNSEFISGRVVNWTFSDPIRRTHIPFSVAYGTDKEKVREAGIAAALRVPTTIVDDEQRKPDVWLVRMGDNALEFELLVWINQETVKSPGTTHTSYMWELETELRERGIEIPFPQRDLYIKNSKLTVAVEAAQPAAR